MSSNSLDQQTVSGSHNIFSATGDVYVVQNPAPPAEVETRRGLSILLDKVKSFWIEGYLEKSLHNSLLIELGKETQPRAIDHPWESILELPDQSSRSLSHGTKIGDIFEQSNRALLILGEPGSGKTITLIELAKELITRAESDKDFGQPIPVIFNLSSWVVLRQPLLDWMAAELSEKYRIPKQLGRVWLQEYRILPLLDGLDEVRAEYQAACTAAINKYCYAFGLAGLAVCCRITDYIALPTKLKLNAAINLQPLTPQQIDEYLSTVDPHLSSLTNYVERDSALQELMQSPLMLNIINLVYQDNSAGLMKEGEKSIDEWRKKIFNAYIEIMFKRKGKSQLYSSFQTTKWLSWLAQRMIDHNQSMFSVEQLQPSWLSKRSLIWAYAFISRFLATTVMYLFNPIQLFVAGVVAGSVDGMRFGSSNAMNSRKNILTKGLKYFWRNGLFHGILIGAWSWFYYQLIIRSYRELIIESLRTVYLSINPYTSPELAFGLMSGLVGPISLLTAILYSIVVFRLGDRPIASTHDINAMEKLYWTWKGAFRGLLLGLLFGVVNGVIAYWIVLTQGSSFGLDYSACITCGQQVGIWLTVWMTLWIGGLTGVINGLRGHKVEAGNKQKQDVRIWMRNAGIGVLIFGIVIGMIVASSGLVVGMVGGNLLLGVIFVAIFSIIGVMMLVIPFLVYGGLDIIKHITIRFLLSLSEHLPWNLTAFLDYASEKVFLYRVGGGYIFIHRLLMEHFAAMYGSSDSGID